MRLKSKKGNPPSVLGFHLQSLTPLEMFPAIDGEYGCIAPARERDVERFLRSLSQRDEHTIIEPFPTDPDRVLLSRFLAKIGLETVALILLRESRDAREVTQERQLDPLRRYARYGEPPKYWPYNKRTLYPPDEVFCEPGSAPFEMLHDWTLMYTQERNLYLILALFGVEYALNLCVPDTQDYKDWLSQNPGRSPVQVPGREG